MSIQVRCFNKNKADEALKKCPKIVRDYVKLLLEHNVRQTELTNKAIAKLRELSREKTDITPLI